MKKTLALLLALILTFSCVSLFTTGVAMAEGAKENQISSNFDAANTSKWSGTAGCCEFLDDNGDGTNDFARINGSADKSAFLYTPTAVVEPGNTYEISFYARVPADVVTKDFASFTYNSSTYKFNPRFTIFQPGNAAGGEKIQKTYSEGQNDYAYSYESATTHTRRTDFTATWTIGDYDPYVRPGYSNFTSQHYTVCKDENGNEVSPNEVYKDWTKVTVTFIATEDDENKGAQVVAFSFCLDKGLVGLSFDVKDFSLVCTDDGTETKTILNSDFSNTDETNWFVSNNNVKFLEENGEDYARINISPDSQGSGLASPSFNLVADNKYELSYYIRIPEESISYMIGSAYYAPSVSFYIPKVTTAGSTVPNMAQTGTANNTLTGNNFYAYTYSDSSNPDKSWSRRNDFSLTWKIGDYPAKTKQASSLAYNDQKSYFNQVAVNEVYADWTKVTATFTAVASEAGEKSQITALAFSFLDYKSSNNLVFDIKDVVLTETSSKIKPEPELPEDTIFYEGFENITQAELEAFFTNRTWSKPSLNSNDAATGKKSATLNAYWENLFIPIDKSSLETGTIYEFSMDWKLDAPTSNRNASISKLSFIGYNPSQGEVIKTDAKDLVALSSIPGTGNWENTRLRFKIIDPTSYEQFGILLKYASSDNTHTLYVDTLLLAPSQIQGNETPLNLVEEEETDDTIKVLAFGNSFSADATAYIGLIANADNKDLRVGNASIGGCSLQRHYNNMLNGTTDYGFSYYTKDRSRPQTFTSVSMQQVLITNDWDYIVIQQVSQNSGMPETFEPYLSELLAYFKEKCPNAEIRFHATWAYAQDSTHSGFNNYGKDQTTMHEAIEDAYLQASKKYGYAQILPSGEAIRRARATVMGDNFNRDGYHLNDKGRMIAALVWYENFTGISALDTKIDLTTLVSSINSGSTVELTKEEELIIKTVAHEAVELFKLANEAQLAIEAIGEVDENSGDAINKANALRAELNDDDLLPNLQTLIDANDAYAAIAPDSEVVAGDINGDNTVDLNDVVVLAQYAAGWEITCNEAALDVDGSGLVDLSDVVLLAQYVAGWEVELV